MTGTHSRSIIAAGCAGAAGLALALALAVGSSARAQNALGGGSRLDANPSVTGGRVNTVNQGTNFNERNLLITGDVAGGRGFRGTVGYRAAGDFSGQLGSNDTYQFRAYSASTGVPFLDYGRSTDPLRMGQDLGLVEYHRSGYTAPVAATQRPTAAHPAPNISPAPKSSQLPTALPPPSSESGAYSDAQMRMDQILSASSLLSQNEVGSVPNFVGRVYTPDGKLLAADASSLRGLRYTPPEWMTQSYGLTTLDLVRSLDDMTSGRTQKAVIGRPYETEFSSLPADQRVGADAATPETPKPEAGPADLRIKPQSADDKHREILERIAKRYANTDNYTLDLDPTLLKQLDKDFGQLRSHLRTGSQAGMPVRELEREPGVPGITTPEDDSGIAPPRGGTTPPTGSSPTNPQPGTSDLGIGATVPRPATTPAGTPIIAPQPTVPEIVDATKLAQPQLTTTRERIEALRRRGGDRDPVPTMASPIDVRDFGAILRHGEQVQKLSTEDKTRFNELLSAAEEKMAAHDYFLAERRFTRALRYTPGHPMALAGVVNAQLGAGLYLSAAYTFRSLAGFNPEMIDTYYSANLLPAPADMKKAVEELRKKFTDKYCREQDKASSGMLLAYVGHQQRDRALIEEGLARFREFNPEDPLLPLLETVWLGADADKAKDATPPVTAPATPPPAPAGSPDK